MTLYKHLQHTLPLYKGIHPILQLRLIDDNFGIFNGTLEKLKSWILFLNNSHPTITFTIDSSPSHIPFLDTLVYLVNNKLHIRLYKKPTDNKQFLHFSSEHPYDTKRAIPYTQAIRYKRIILDPQILKDEINFLKQKFTSRSYPPHIVQRAIELEILQSLGGLYDGMALIV